MRGFGRLRLMANFTAVFACLRSSVINELADRFAGKGSNMNRLFTAAVVIIAGLALFLVVIPALSRVFDPINHVFQTSADTRTTLVPSE
jgi:uncharacterized membrane protein